MAFASSGEYVALCSVVYNGLSGYTLPVRKSSTNFLRLIGQPEDCKRKSSRRSKIGLISRYPQRKTTRCANIQVGTIQHPRSRGHRRARTDEYPGSRRVPANQGAQGLRLGSPKAHPMHPGYWKVAVSQASDRHVGSRGHQCSDRCAQLAPGTAASGRR